MSFAILVLIVVCSIVLLGAVGWGMFLLLVQLGVIVNESRKPVYKDTNDYTLNQGRDVGRDEQRESQR